MADASQKFSSFIFYLDDFLFLFFWGSGFWSWQSNPISGFASFFPSSHRFGFFLFLVDKRISFFGQDFFDNGWNYLKSVYLHYIWFAQEKNERTEPKYLKHYEIFFF